MDHQRRTQTRDADRPFLGRQHRAVDSEHGRLEFVIARQLRPSFSPNGASSGVERRLVGEPGKESALPADGLWVHNGVMRNAVQQSRAEVLAELYATGALVASERDEEIIAELTATSEWGDELRQMGESDPDLLDR